MRIVNFMLLTLLIGCQTKSEQTKNMPAQSTATASGPCLVHPNPARKIAISSPCDRAQVAARDFVEGTVADSNAQVWVVIHPLEAGDFWVQPSVTVKDNGSWRVLVYFGEPDLHVGKPYQVIAIANPRQGLNEGQLLNSWPEAQWRSDVVDVVRK